MDAFNVNNYKAQKFNPNIVIISGIFERFGDNTLINHAIKEVVNIIQEDRYLIYTRYPYHPQLKQIANVLKTHQNELWIICQRSQYELDMLFTEKGFKKERMLIDNWGIFTVSTVQFNSKKKLENSNIHSKNS